MRFPLFTSIKPTEGVTYLRTCLASWRAAGFSPVAVNGPSETAALRALDLPVEFSPLAADGKPRIGAILDAVRASGATHAGIINADCVICRPDIAANLKAGLNGRVAIAWRIDVGGDKPAAIRLGFDAFFFDTRFLPADDCGFSIGDPCWDQWFPLACERMGAAVETLPLLLAHRVHPLNWSRQQVRDNGRRMWTWLGRPGRPSKDDLHHMGADIPFRLHAHPQTISLTGVPEADIALRAAGRAMLALPSRRQVALVRLIELTIPRLIRQPFHPARLRRRWQAVATLFGGFIGQRLTHGR
jgi:hypothetical protein